jgi:uncharacterized protein YlxW (UPF0749 family)
VKRWFKTRRQLLAELRNLERAVRDYRHKQTLTLAALDEIEATVKKMDAGLDGVADRLMLAVFGISGRNNGG